jgi:hypothetical protein
MEAEWGSRTYQAARIFLLTRRVSAAAEKRYVFVLRMGEARRKNTNLRGKFQEEVGWKGVAGRTREVPLVACPSHSRDQTCGVGIVSLRENTGRTAEEESCANMGRWEEEGRGSDGGGGRRRD